ATMGKPLVLRLTRKDGTAIWVEQHNVPLYDEKGGLTAVEGIVRDITGRKKMEERLQYLAMHDPLTGLPNRRSLEKALQQAAAKAKQGVKSALLFIDLDHFKLVNDTLGHAAGDGLLIAVACILKGRLSEEDFLARLGGDEFALLLEGTTAGEAGATAEDLRRAVEESELSPDPHGPGVNLSISVGLVMVDGSLDVQKLLSLADTALYRAKEEGRNTVALLSPGENAPEKLAEINRLLATIKSALKENRLLLFFQPVFGVKDERIVHHEVLVRLQEKNGDILLPGTFIPVAERFGLMPRIDRRVVQSALNNLRQYPSLNLFVNLSGTSLGDEALLEFIEENIRTGGVDPSRLGFEITETAAVKNPERAGRWIRRLKKIGCRFALDDFGMGFSSFSHLRDLPVDYLKIDGSYVKNLDADPTHFALVRAMNTVAHTLGKKTVAEYVENEKILNILRDLDIDCGQGYHLGRPSIFPQEALSGVKDRCGVTA
ncbi:MAG: EAL domain-containing protein, partial [Firmicutes bacterium]|nr:EAL domain-containing protein [Bacillota bacterium]